MPLKRIPLIIILFLVVLCVHTEFPAATFAQAWVPEKGDGSVSVTYQNLVARDHINFTGARASNLGTVRAHSMLIDFEYGITDKLAFNTDLAYIGSNYRGPLPESPFDNGRFHSAFQDAHFHVRYNVLKNPAVVTPFIGVTIPTHNYGVLGHSAIGRGFHELLIGVNAGRQLGPILPNVYFHGRYSYTILKRFEGMNLNRSNVDWEVGWLATGKLTLRFLGAWQKSYGGLNLPVDLHSEEDHEIHDRAARADFVRLGGGATFSVNRSFDIDIAYATTVWGRNIHAVGGMALGFSWRFSRGHDISKISAKNSPRSIPIAEQALF